jgi:hypothetical protein
MKRIIFSIAVLVILALNSIAAAVTPAKADFNGVWKLDPAKSSGLQPGTEKTITVMQTRDTFKVVTKLITEQGEQSNSETYILDGKEAEFTANLSESATNSSDNGVETSTAKKVAKGKVAAKQTAEGIEIKSSFVYATEDGDKTVKMTRKWTLSLDGKTLNIDITVQNSGGELQSRHIFNKN